ncbi:MAG: alanine-zipper protein [Actinomycetota bacterium]
MKLVPPIGDDLPKAADELFALALAEFTTARNDLAKQLKADGDPKASAEVAALAKPSLAAWALNQLARGQSNLIEEMIKADEALRAPKSRAEIREASQVRNEIIRKIVLAASDVLTANGHNAGPAVAQKITQTLLAVGATADASQDLLAGRLQKDLEPGALEPSWEQQPGASSGPTPDTSDQVEAQRRRKALSDEVTKLSNTADDLRRKAEEAQDRAINARVDAERAEATAELAEKKADDASEALERKRGELAT